MVEYYYHIRPARAYYVQNISHTLYINMTYMHAYIHIDMYTYIYMHTYIHAYIHIDMYTYIHAHSHY
jgi:hypothetical protein